MADIKEAEEDARSDGERHELGPPIISIFLKLAC